MGYYPRLRDLREDADLSQTALVQKLSMHKTTYTNYEQGKREPPFSLIIRLAVMYNVTIDYIAGLTQKSTPLKGTNRKKVKDNAKAERLKQDISIGANLRRLRKRAGLSQEIATAKLQVMGIPVSREILSRMELGRYSIRISALLGMKEIYRATFDEFFQGVSLEDMPLGEPDKEEPNLK